MKCSDRKIHRNRAEGQRGRGERIVTANVSGLPFCRDDNVLELNGVAMVVQLRDV